MRRVAIVGAGVFGLSAALELSRSWDVTVFEREDDVLLGASASNHLRHHRGYHYPRSEKTALEALSARASFESAYGSCVVEDFPAYYGVSKAGSRTTPESFLAFCRRLGLPFEEAWPEPRLMDRSRVELCVRVPEPVYDPGALRALMARRLARSGASLRLRHEVLGARSSGREKVLTVRGEGGAREEAFDCVVGATYSRPSPLAALAHGAGRRELFELVELLEIAAPSAPVGLTVVDGEFSSLLPRGASGSFTLGHVRASVLEAAVAEAPSESLQPAPGRRSNAAEILSRGVEDFPFLSEARVLRSLLVTRMVKAGTESTDERPSEVRRLADGVYSLFAGKVITCVDTAKALARAMDEEVSVDA